MEIWNVVMQAEHTRFKMFLQVNLLVLVCASFFHFPCANLCAKQLSCVSDNVKVQDLSFHGGADLLQLG